jgi:NADH dehydrogenase (ubiquinone) 1 alpha subcomplex subunit 2
MTMMAVFRKHPILRDMVRELRLHLSQTDPSSEGLRQFIRNHYLSLKNQYPSLPILIRECENITPKVCARYDYGKELKMDLSHLSSEQVHEAILKLMNTKKTSSSSSTTSLPQ